jgi:hypothetical protein
MINIHRYRTYSTLSERTLLDCPHFDVLLTYTHISNRWTGRTTSHDQYLCVLTSAGSTHRKLGGFTRR